MQPSDLLADLTDAQREAVTCTEGPLLILAAAGSGKTRVITRRVAYLLQQGVRPSSILAITFTNKAAGEMRQRVESLLPGNRVWISTFHSMGARLLRQYGERLNLDRNFTIYDVDDRNKLIKLAVEDAGLHHLVVLLNREPIHRMPEGRNRRCLRFGRAARTGGRTHGLPPGSAPSYPVSAPRTWRTASGLAPCRWSP